ncbi:NmrA family NAD(P)-binding protein [Aquimarina spinulae]|uniref:NmrA family NAD(P)-binding protein n=1 Tax=Aquimarina spinulae TaxID=1192023 RepID=UPI000D555786|nr:NmrA family NAD(P)-binding protein [Aquimarina spinulae]
MKILVTAANGHTGFTTAIEVLNLGVEVRAFVRNPNSKKAQELKKMGAEIFVGDIEDIKDVRRALTGIQRAYFVPTYPNVLFQGATFATVLEELAIEHVVLLTQWTSSNRHPSIYTKEHWLVDQIFGRLKQTKLTVLNPGLFAFVYFMTPAPLTQFGMLPDFGENAPPSNEDIGLVAAHILKDPSAHINKTYRVTGKAVLNAKQMANIIGTIVGRKVKAIKMSNTMMYKVLRAYGYPQRDASQVVAHYVEEAHKGTFGFNAPNSIVKNITGKEADDFLTIAQKYLSTMPEAKQTFKNKLKAMRFMIKVVFTKTWDMKKYEKEQGFPNFKNTSFCMDSEEWKLTHK